jgi:hypothetical protein
VVLLLLLLVVVVVVVVVRLRTTSHGFFSSSSSSSSGSNIWNVRRLRRVGSLITVARILVGKSEGKKPLGRPRRRWKDNIKMDLREVGWDGMDWIDLVQDRDQRRALVNMVMNLRVPPNIRQFLSS